MTDNNAGLDTSIFTGHNFRIEQFVCAHSEQFVLDRAQGLYPLLENTRSQIHAYLKQILAEHYPTFVETSKGYATLENVFSDVRTLLGEYRDNVRTLSCVAVPNDAIDDKHEVAPDNFTELDLQPVIKLIADGYLESAAETIFAARQLPVSAKTLIGLDESACVLRESALRRIRSGVPYSEQVSLWMLLLESGAVDAASSSFFDLQTSRQAEICRSYAVPSLYAQLLGESLAAIESSLRLFRRVFLGRVPISKFIVWTAMQIENVSCLVCKNISLCDLFLNRNAFCDLLSVFVKMKEAGLNFEFAFESKHEEALLQSVDLTFTKEMHLVCEQISIQTFFRDCRRPIIWEGFQASVSASVVSLIDRCRDLCQSALTFSKIDGFSSLFAEHLSTFLHRFVAVVSSIARDCPSFSAEQGLESLSAIFCIKKLIGNGLLPLEDFAEICLENVEAEFEGHLQFCTSSFASFRVRGIVDWPPCDVVENSHHVPSRPIHRLIRDLKSYRSVLRQEFDGDVSSRAMNLVLCETIRLLACNDFWRRYAVESISSSCFAQISIDVEYMQISCFDLTESRCTNQTMGLLKQVLHQAELRAQCPEATSTSDVRNKDAG
uniref:Uncharacterized protein n=1 Tax=Spongospora subterranea TaxID=70186 RepID=A0A0H5RAB0_9EUKA|eukprot:CRZ10607.1 hypothetical protein [Spongospora subterranea]